MEGMVPEDVYELTSVSQPRLAPDGSTAAVVVTIVDRDANDYGSAIWMVPTDGSEEPRPFTTGVKHDSTPRWSPDGTLLAFTSDRDSDAKQLYIIPTAGGEALRLTGEGKEQGDAQARFRQERGAGSAGPQEESGAGSAGPQEESGAGSAGPQEESRAGSAGPQEESGAGSAGPQEEGRAGSAGPQEEGRAGAADPQSQRAGSARPQSERAGSARPDEESVEEVEWAPDSHRLVFSRRVRHEDYNQPDDKKRNPRRVTKLWFKLDNVGWTADRRKHLFVKAGPMAEPRQLTEGDFEDSQPAWSPDGSTIAFASARHEDWDVEPYADIYLIDVDSFGKAESEPRPLTSGGGFSEAPAWSPDGKRIAYRFTPGVWDEPHHAQIAVIDAEGGEPTLLTTSLDRNCGPYPSIGNPVWVENDVLFGVEDGGNTHLYRVAADGSGKPEPVVEGNLNVVGYDAAGGVVTHCATTPLMPPELFVGDSQLSDFSKQFTNGRALVEPERFTATSEDGSEVDAWIVRPPGFESSRSYPALLTIHGGPFTQYGNRFFDEVQVFANAGYVVLFSNPRGSSGYGEEWGRAIRGPVEGGPGMGSVDYQDCMAVVDEALRRFEGIDAERLGVIGGSYGGFMTSWIVGHSKRFKAACSERAVNDWTSMNGSSDLGPLFAGYVGAQLFEKHDAYLQISPAAYAEEITTPLLILHSENDLRCNIEQAEQLFSILRVLKREVEMVRFPAEGHELSRSGAPYHRVKRFEVILEWFGRWLNPSQGG